MAGTHPYNAFDEDQRIFILDLANIFNNPTQQLRPFYRYCYICHNTNQCRQYIENTLNITFVVVIIFYNNAQITQDIQQLIHTVIQNNQQVDSCHIFSNVNHNWWDQLPRSKKFLSANLITNTTVLKIRQICSMACDEFIDDYTERAADNQRNQQ
ncbi:unnamed protein product [Didymodactylos carnosus]|uniref:Uncharacterized protein n=1 Tax=Didymodactylos carnosus TaxID=1234261 RepID=A0A8S2J3S9_9BILA|nr:unnamed protein product [Didymodactylos carnosus]CAF3778998.1 unnamed protein product [Didymodactylos carnosus]